jgi:hypothetical protein
MLRFLILTGAGLMAVVVLGSFATAIACADRSDPDHRVIADGRM